MGIRGDFGGPEIPSSNNFCLNGIVRADRSWSPAAWEVKKVYQDVAFRLLDYNRGIVEIFNELFFKSLEHTDLKWELLKDGIVVNSGTVPNLKVMPQETCLLELPFPKLEDRGAEYCVNVYAIANKDYSLIKKWVCVGCRTVCITLFG